MVFHWRDGKKLKESFVFNVAKITLSQEPAHWALQGFLFGFGGWSLLISYFKLIQSLTIKIQSASFFEPNTSNWFASVSYGDIFKPILICYWICFSFRGTQMGPDSVQRIVVGCTISSQHLFQFSRFGSDSSFLNNLWDKISTQM
jgi:hypothetical protein